MILLGQNQNTILMKYGTKNTTSEIMSDGDNRPSSYTGNDVTSRWSSRLLPLSSSRYYSFLSAILSPSLSHINVGCIGSDYTLEMWSK